MISVAPINRHLYSVVPLIALLLCGSPRAAEQPEDTFLTPQQLEEYQFEQGEQEEIEVSDLSLGQRFIMANQRRNVMDLISRQLGIVELRGGLDDLKVLQRIVDDQLISQEDSRGWQAVGVVFGDMLADRLDLHWVQVEDEVGVSKALQWKKTHNFVFPITMLSKRQQWGQPIDLGALYGKIRNEVSQFRETLAERARRE
jgi:hypothetical protein|tara:strand:+ start:26838 stop:27437 length:600 start_codon:yes stop_codon:yes gene_type:complete